MKKKPNYAEARREIIESGIRLGAGDFIDMDALEVAAEALERLSKQPAMKDHERIFFALCYNLRDTHKPRVVVNILAETIPHKRCWYYLRKWGNLGFYNYGVTEDLGWFELDKIPQRYQEIVEENPATVKRYTPPERLVEAVRPAIAGLVPGVANAARLAMEAIQHRAEEILREQNELYKIEHPLELTAAELAMLAAEEKTESGLLEED